MKVIKEADKVKGHWWKIPKMASGLVFLWQGSRGEMGKLWPAAIFGLTIFTVTLSFLMVCVTSSTATLNIHQLLKRDLVSMACAHRWSNHFFKETVKVILPNGACYEINAELDFASVNKTRPCLYETQIKADSSGKGIAWHGWCQAGFSAEFSLDGNTLLLGAVGSIAWRGTIISLTEASGTNPPSPVADVTSWFPVGNEDESYVGYSVSSGYFTNTDVVEGVTGAPRAYEHGRVYIYNLRDFSLYTEIHGPGMSSYFGARVLGMYINGDAWSDLLVGAPLYSEDQDEGCVYIYRNEGFGVMILEDQLKGSRIPKARFGSSIENVGDLNMDGYDDVAVGAPYEDDMMGAVYIYHGDLDGIKTTFSQRIVPATFDPSLRSFGHSISGLVDIDANGYTDLAIGSYESGRATVFLSRPVIEMDPRLEFSRAPIDIKKGDCVLGDKRVPCVQAITCFRYRGHAVPPTIPIDFTIETDWYKTQKGQPARLQFVDDRRQPIGTVKEGTLQLGATVQKCVVSEAHIDVDMKDFLSPIPFKVSYTLRTSHNRHSEPLLSCRDVCPMFDMYSSNNVTELISFVHNCGNDSMCETDLQLKASIHIPRGTKYLPIGVEDHFLINVDIYNNGEEAHQAKVKITHSKELSFVNVRSDISREALVLCNPEKSENETYIMCDVDNPMPAFGRSRFTVKVGIRTLHPDTEFLNVFVEAMTSSTEHNTTLTDNTQVLLIQTKIEADVVVRGVARPESLLYDSDKAGDDSSNDREQYDVSPGIDFDPMNESISLSEMKEIDSSQIGPHFQHVYDVRNLGPSSLPLMSTVNISFPWKTREGKMLTYIEDIRLNGLGSCDHVSITENQDGLLDAKTWNASNTPPDPQSSAQTRNPYSHSLKTLNCDTVECVNIVCTVGPLSMGGGVVIEIEARIWQNTFKEVWSDNTGFIALWSEASLIVQNPNNRHIQPATHRPDTHSVATMLYTEAAVQPKTVSKWLIALGIICGIVCLLVLILVMWKVGFFKRPMREEMERLIQEKDEIENLNPDDFGDMNGYDQEFY
ncbi:integrin alpha-9-like isoform X3 [Apostichopus japonicus]|uniref:integrin alpha-9-like isoform X3 n=2 Tax=Stichopus japonicus TaxID=307972 RepID=UPI003AB697CE